MGEVGGKEGEKKRRVREGRKSIHITLHVPMMLANIDVRLPWFINKKFSIKEKNIEHIEVDIAQ